MRPIFFHLGPLPVYSFGFMVAAGLLLSMRLMTLRARRDGFPAPEQAADMVFTVVLSGFAGARLFYVLENPAWYAENPFLIFAFWEGGLIFYGGMISALAALLCFLAVKKIGMLRGLDFILPYVALSHTFGRVGCFLNGCCYGTACEFAWCVRQGEMTGTFHPVQLYEALFNALLFAFLNALYGRKRFDGQVAGLYFMFYALGRFVLEFWRGVNPYWGPLTHNQWISIFVMLAAGFFYGLKARETAGGGHSLAGEKDHG